MAYGGALCCEHFTVLAGKRVTSSKMEWYLSDGCYPDPCTKHGAQGCAGCVDEAHDSLATKLHVSAVVTLQPAQSGCNYTHFDKCSHCSELSGNGSDQSVFVKVSTQWSKTQQVREGGARMKGMATGKVCQSRSDEHDKKSVFSLNHTTPHFPQQLGLSLAAAAHVHTCSSMRS